MFIDTLCDDSSFYNLSTTSAEYMGIFFDLLTGDKRRLEGEEGGWGKTTHDDSTPRLNVTTKDTAIEEQTLYQRGVDYIRRIRMKKKKAKPNAKTPQISKYRRICAAEKDESIAAQRNKRQWPPSIGMPATMV